LQDIQRVATPFRIRSIRIRVILNGKNNLRRAKKKMLMHQNRVFIESIRKEATPMSVFNTTFDIINTFSSSRL
jgi:RNase P/RNase MRP subunit p30